MNLHSIMLFLLMTVLTSCGDMKSQEQPKHGGRTAEKQETTRTSRGELTDDTAEGDDGEDGEEDEEDNEDDEEEDIKEKKKDQKDDDRDADIILSDDKKDVKYGTATLYSNRREDSHLQLRLRSNNRAWQTVSWPKDREAITVPSLCVVGKNTEIELQVIDAKQGTISPGSSDLGLRKYAGNSVEFGYESKGSCNGKGCQDDNIMTITCDHGVKLKGLE